MLVINNMDVYIPEKPTVYDEVMSVWVNAMVVLNKLVAGIPQRVSNGEALLGLCAWHLYPDIYVIGSPISKMEPATLVKQYDCLVLAGGLLTIGLCEGQGRNIDGISWSMPLAHLRYYGKPVECSQTLHSANLRLSFRQVVQLAMGSIAR